MSRQAAAISFAVLVFAVAAGVSFQTCRARAEFTDLAIADAHCRALGYHTTFLRPGAMESLVVADRSISREQAAEFELNAGNNKTPGIFVLYIAPTNPLDDDPHARRLHNLFAVGDPKLIAAIAESLR